MIKKIIHIGPPKTGSTYLQRTYFPNIPNLTFLFRSDYDNLQSRNIGKAVLLSKEALAGKAWNDDWKRGIKNEHRYIESFDQTVKNLQLVHPDARIIIIFRKHGDWLISMYKQYVLEGGILNFKDFYNENGVLTDNDLNYSKRIEFLKGRFDDVDVLSFEQFKKEGPSYYDRYFASLGFGPSQIHSNSGVNASMSGKKLELLRNINKYYPTIPQSLRNLLRKNGMEPRRVLRTRMKFWKTTDTSELKETKIQVNNKFASDWEKVENHFWK